MKTTLLAATTAVAAAGVAYVGWSQLPAAAGASVWLVALVGVSLLIALGAALTVLGGLVVLHRDSLQSTGRTDLFIRLNQSRSEAALERAGSRGFGVSRFRVGDMVEVRSLTQIRRTLDAHGCFDGLPFMPEMAKYCGRRFRVFRSVDKVYDYGRTKTLRRMKDAVLLLALRCDGSEHAGCQAACYLIWKTAWLRPAGQSVTQAEAEPAVAGLPSPCSGCVAAAGSGDARYKCQYTEIAAASTPMRSWDYRQDLRPLLAGNVTFAAFAVAALTRLFNRVQRMRGGVAFPYMPRGTNSKTPLVNHGLRRGDPVRVLPAPQISLTLNERSYNRGLWFDADMLKHTDQRRTVHERVERIIDDVSGRMVVMKTACIVLAGCDSSGEYLRFCPQHDYPYWREAWLTPESRSESQPDEQPVAVHR